MTRDLPDAVTVELDAAELGEARVVGTLRRNPASSGAIIGFAYADAWIARPDAFPLDPRHGLYPGEQWPRDGQLDGIFADAAPDRWGRTLMARQEASVAREGQRARRQLDDWAYLLGVSDVARMGALRFRTQDGRALDDRMPGIPPMARLPALVAAARSIERPGRDPRQEARDLAILLDPGSSLGGARPKASIQADDGSLWIAKFPSRTDPRDMAACEWVLNELAAAAGIEVPEHRLETLGRGHRVFLAQRFDRIAGSRRLYASAMTLLGRRGREATSYLDVALAVADHGARGTVDRQLTDLFRRVAFAVLVAHRDDHLRNHGFLRTVTGWQLAPAFDLNPMPEQSEHELAIDEADHRGDIGTLLRTAGHYRLDVGAAQAIVDEVRRALAGWRAVARAAGLGRVEIETLEDAIAP